MPSTLCVHDIHTGLNCALTGIDRKLCSLKAQVIIKRGEKVDGPEGPIVVATRNNDLQGVVDATPPERREGSASCVTPRCSFKQQLLVTT